MYYDRVIKALIEKEDPLAQRLLLAGLKPIWVSSVGKSIFFDKDINGVFGVLIQLNSTTNNMLKTDWRFIGSSKEFYNKHPHTTIGLASENEINKLIDNLKTDSLHITWSSVSGFAAEI